jgi:3-hydroxyisobutyrate dehydrogenase
MSGRRSDPDGSIAVERVGFLGQGVMGAPMAHNLAEHGFEVTVWNRTPKLPPAGATAAGSAAEAVREAPVVVSCLFDDASVEAVLLEPSVLDAFRPGAVVVDASTIAPETAHRVAAALDERGVAFVDAPVTGGAEGARRGTLTFLCGGPVEAFQRVEPVLLTMGARALHLGRQPGAGQAAKAVNQVILAGTFLGVAEGITLAQAAGLDAEEVVDALSGGAAASWVLSNRGPFMAKGDYPGLGKVELHLKDLGIVHDMMTSLGLTLDGVRHVIELESELVARGLGHLDVSAVHLAIRAANGLAQPPDAR